jgi:hypothetical protein
VGSFFRSGFKLINTVSDQLTEVSSVDNYWLNYGVDINPGNESMVIGGGGSYYIKMSLNAITKVLVLEENYTLSFSGYYEGNLCFDISGDYLL